MQRPLLPSSSRRAPARAKRGAAAAGVFALIACLVACKGGETTDAASTSPSAAALVASAAAMSTANVPPPPAILAVASTPAAAPAVASSGAAGELVSVHAQLEATLSHATACSADSECRTVATGAKACGGPTGYRAYSAAKADPATVAALADREHELGMAAARASGEVSPCFMLADPGAHCQKNRCVTGPSGTH